MYEALVQLRLANEMFAKSFANGQEGLCRAGRHSCVQCAV